MHTTHPINQKSSDALGITISTLLGMVAGTIVMLYASGAMALDVGVGSNTGIKTTRGSVANSTATNARVSGVTNIGIHDDVDVNLNAGSDARANLRSDSNSRRMRTDSLENDRGTVDANTNTKTRMHWEKKDADIRTGTDVDLKSDNEISRETNATGGPTTPNSINTGGRASTKLGVELN